MLERTFNQYCVYCVRMTKAHRWMRWGLAATLLLFYAVVCAEERLTIIGKALQQEMEAARVGWKRRCAGLAMALIMLIGLVPAQAWATEVEVHSSHLSCGVTDCENAAHGHSEVGAWIALTQDNALSSMDNNNYYLMDNNNYYLSENITVSSAIRISGTVNLCLNGKNLTYVGTSDVGILDVESTATLNGILDVESTATLNLCSCAAGGTIKRTAESTGMPLIYARNGARVNLYNVTLDGGAVWSGSKDSVLGRGTSNTGGITSTHPLIDAGFQKKTGGHITLYEGVVMQNNSCSIEGHGGAITIGEDGSLVINGAVIRNNEKTSGQAGAIKAYAGATITMNGGEIYGNQADTHGGAVQIFGNDSTDRQYAIFTMYGGTIRNNKADDVGGAIAVSNYSSFRMSGGEIVDNATTDSKERGGGVGFGDPNTTMCLSGNAVITGNMPNNLYVGSNSNNTVSISAMTSGAKVGVTKSGGTGIFSSGGASYVASKYFVSDNRDYVVAADGEDLQLIPHTHNAHCVCGGGVTTGGHRHIHDAEALTWTEWNGSGSFPGGSVYLTKDVTINSTIKITDDTNLCLFGFDISSDKTVFEVDNNAMLNICDCLESGSIIYNGTTDTCIGIMSGTVNLYGGTVSCPTGRSNTGISTTESGSLNVYGGAVFTSDKNLSSDTAISNNGTTKIFGGTVTSIGKAVLNDTGSLTVSGGTLQSTNDPCIDNLNQVSITGGTIISTNDYGLYNRKGRNGTPTTYLSGDVQIQGRPAGVYDVNAYGIIVNGALTNSTPISIKRGTGVFASPSGDITTLEAYAGKFVSADPACFVETVGNDLAFVARAITQQPTAVNSYTVETNYPDGASYQWYEVTSSNAPWLTTDHADKISINDDETYADYSDEKAAWMSGYSSTCDPVLLTLAGGTMIRVTPVGSTTIRGMEIDGAFFTQKGEYWELALSEDTLKCALRIYYAEECDPNEDGFKIQIIETTLGSVVSGQTAKSLTAETDGSYACKVTWDVGEKNIVCISDVVEYTAPAEPSHSHCVCGNAHTSIGNHTAIDSKTFTVWDGRDMDDSLSGIQLASGSYYLTDDLTINDILYIYDDVTVDFCLNGHTLDVKGGTIEVKGILNITDCQTGGKIVSTTSSTNPIVWVNTDHDCAGIVNLYQGELSGHTNSSNQGGGAVYITQNNTNIATFNMYGGMITGNTASNDYYGVGGGVSVQGGAFNMYGGTISGNTALGSERTSGGGGVYVNGGTFQLSGSAKVTGNFGKDRTSANNIFLNNGAVFSVGSSGLASGASFGVTIHPKPDSDRSIPITGDNGADYSAYFFADDSENYEVVNENDVLKLQVKGASAPVNPNPGDPEPATCTVTFAANGGSDTMTAVTVESGETWTLPACGFTAPAGMRFKAWKVGETEYAAGDSVTISANTIVTAVWEEITYTVSGTVTDTSGDTATVKLMQGNTEVKTATVTLYGSDTNYTGTYSFTGVAPGVYNIVVTKGDVTMTVLVTVKSADVEVGTISMPDGQKNSVVNNTAAGSFAAVVGGLDKIASKRADNSPYDNADVVNVALIVTEKTEQSAPAAEVQRIKDEAENKTLAFLDLTLTKTVNGTADNSIGSTNTQLLTIVFPFDTAGKDGFAVYRYHGSAVQTLTDTVNSEGEKIEVGDGFITVYAKKFSTYAIGYTASDSGGSPGGQQPVRPNRRPSSTVSYSHSCESKCEVCGSCTDKNCTEKACAVKCKLFTMNFWDVLSGQWYADAVEYVYHHSIMEGYSANAFNPDGGVTRQQVWRVLARMSGANPESMAAARTWAMENGVSDGSNPTAYVTRQQLVTMLWRYAKLQGEDVSVGEDTNILSYVDAFDIAEYAIPAVQWACGSSVMEGYENGSLKPAHKSTRAHMAAMLQRFFAATEQ